MYTVDILYNEENTALRKVFVKEKCPSAVEWQIVAAPLMLTILTVF